ESSIHEFSPPMKSQIGSGCGAGQAGRATADPGLSSDAYAASSTGPRREGPAMFGSAPFFRQPGPLVLNSLARKPSFPLLTPLPARNLERGTRNFLLFPFRRPRRKSYNEPRTKPRAGPLFRPALRVPRSELG